MSLSYCSTLMACLSTKAHKSSFGQFFVLLVCDISKPFIVCLFCGNSKPAAAELSLKNLVEELITGITFHGHHLHVSVKGFVCDAVARTFIKCTEGHTAYYGCERCEQKGVRVDRRIGFPEINAKKRTEFTLDK